MRLTLTWINGARPVCIKRSKAVRPSEPSASRRDPGVGFLGDTECGRHFTVEGKTKERAMKPAIKLLLRRSLMTLGAILVWAKALAGGKADEQTQSTPETDQKKAGGRQQEPNRKT